MEMECDENHHISMDEKKNIAKTQIYKKDIFTALGGKEFLK